MKTGQSRVPRRPLFHAVVLSIGFVVGGFLTFLGRKFLPMGAVKEVLTTGLSPSFGPLKVDLIGLNPVAGSIAALPLEDGSITSLSCLHVVEHVGLGRYGDQLDPLGTRRACKELTRVLAPGANLFVSLPVGRPRVCFNAHRVHSPLQVLSYFEGLELMEFSAVDDCGKFREKADLDEMGQANYACGLFWFKLAQTPS